MEYFVCYAKTIRGNRDMVHKKNAEDFTDSLSVK